MTNTNHTESTAAVEELPFHGLAITIGLNIDSDTILAAVPAKEGEALASDAEFAAVVVDGIRGDSDESMARIDARITEAITDLLTGRPTPSDVILMGSLFGDVLVFVEREDHRSCWTTYKAEVAALLAQAEESDSMVALMGELEKALTEAIEAQRQQAEGDAAA